MTQRRHKNEVCIKNRPWPTDPEEARRIDEEVRIWACSGKSMKEEEEERRYMAKRRKWLGEEVAFKEKAAADMEAAMAESLERFREEDAKRHCR
jgi:hypothetical protein